MITLTTDFGVSDHYVGTMKGVILRTCPDALLVDITHELPPYSIYAGAYAIAQAAPYFPDGTVHVIVVDPGVGTARRPIVMEADGQVFVAPDNGVLSLVIAEELQVRAFEIVRPDLALPILSRTFHGRDIFAPVAAALARRSVLPNEVGPEITDLITILDLAPQQIRRDWWNGRILSVDRFGNVITSFRSDLWVISGREFRLEVGTFFITAFRNTFADAAAGELFAYLGSSGYIEIGMNRDSAARRMSATIGQEISLRL